MTQCSEATQLYYRGCSREQPVLKRNPNLYESINPQKEKAGLRLPWHYLVLGCTVLSMCLLNHKHLDLNHETEVGV